MANQPETVVNFDSKSQFGGNYTLGAVDGDNMRQDLIAVSLKGTTEQLRNYYNEVPEYYDEFCVAMGKDHGALNLAKIVQSIQDNKAARILDVACGNGLLAKQLKLLGFTDIDGLDFAQGMVDFCKSKGLYNNYICAGIEPDKKVPQVTDGTYDVVCLNGGMIAGHITPSSVPTLARMVKSGGSVVFNITPYYHNNVTEYGNVAVQEKMQSFVDAGVLTNWRKTKHVYFEATGEEAVAYIATVA